MGDVDDDRIEQPVARLQLVFEGGVHAGCDHDGGAHDADLCSALEQPRDLGLGDVQRGGDVGLSDAALVVHPGDLRAEPHLPVDGRAVPVGWLHAGAPFTTLSPLPERYRNRP